MQTLYTAPYITLIFISLVIFSLLAGLIIKLYSVRNNLRRHDILAGIIFVPFFLYILLVSSQTTFNIWRAESSDCQIEGCRIVQGTLDDSQLVKVSEKREENLELLISGEKVVVTNTLNPYTYSHDLGELGVFSEKGKYYQLYIYDGMIIRIKQKLNK